MALALPSPTKERTYTHMAQDFSDALEENMKPHPESGGPVMTPEDFSKSVTGLVCGKQKGADFLECLGFLEGFHRDNAKERFDRIYH